MCGVCMCASVELGGGCAGGSARLHLCAELLCAVVVRVSECMHRCAKTLLTRYLDKVGMRVAAATEVPWPCMCFVFAGRCVRSVSQLHAGPSLRCGGCCWSASCG